MEEDIRYLRSKAEKLLDKKYKKSNLPESVIENPKYREQIKQHYLDVRGKIFSYIKKQVKDDNYSVGDIEKFIKSVVMRDFLNKTFTSQFYNEEISVRAIMDSLGIGDDEFEKLEVVFEKLNRKVGIKDNITRDEYKFIYNDLLELSHSEEKPSKSMNRQDLRYNKTWVRTFVRSLTEEISLAVKANKALSSYFLISEDNLSAIRSVTKADALTKTVDVSDDGDKLIVNFVYKLKLSNKLPSKFVPLPGIAKRFVREKLVPDIFVKDIELNLDFTLENKNDFFEVSLNSIRGSKGVNVSINPVTEKGRTTISLADGIVAKAIMPSLNLLKNQDIFDKL
ncbi:hypothetical protein EBS02_02860 [bacterium]|nr:hypothetical protein [bacterium]